jgi:plasmid stability protein
MSDALRDRLAVQAKERGHSLHAEIIAILEGATGALSMNLVA